MLTAPSDTSNFPR